MTVQTYSKEYVESLIAEKDKHIESLQAKVHLCAGYDKLLADLIQTEEELNKSEAENIKLLQRNEKLQYRMAEFELRNELLEAVYEAAQAVHNSPHFQADLNEAVGKALYAVQTGQSDPMDELVKESEKLGLYDILAGEGQTPCPGCGVHPFSTSITVHEVGCQYSTAEQGQP